MKKIVIGIIGVIAVGVSACANNTSIKNQENNKLLLESNVNNMEIIKTTHVIKSEDNSPSLFTNKAKTTLTAVTFVPFIVGLVAITPFMANSYYATSKSNDSNKFATYPLFIITVPLFVVGIILAIPGLMVFGKDIT